LAVGTSGGVVAGIEKGPPVPIPAVLTDIRIRWAKLRDRQYKLGDYVGLYLLVRPNGSKLWRFDFRFGGK
jgi:hypothetical protein